MADRTRRANGAGSVTTRPDGALIVRVTDPATGQRHKRIVQRGIRDDGRPETPAQHRQRGDKALAKLLADTAASSRPRHAMPTFAEFATCWLNGRRDFKLTTRDHYERIIRLYLIPTIGSVRLDQLTVEHVNKLDADMASAQRAKGRTTRGHARTTLTVILKAAHEDGLLTEVVTTRARKLRSDAPREIDVERLDALDGGEMRRLLVAARDSRYEPLIAVMGLLGLRIGEALGLGWDCIDLTAGELRVRRNLTRAGNATALTSPKTKHCVREVHLDPALVSSLRRWKATQAAERIATPLWVDEHKFPAVFTDEAGRLISHGAVRSALDRCAAAAGLPHVNPHALRHSAGSIALDAGVPIPEVSRMLGHANPAITMGVYAHALGDGTRATNAVAAAVGAW